jgi:hypothetical protein
MPREIMVITEETITRTKIIIRIVTIMARTVAETTGVTVRSTLTVIVKETVTELMLTAKSLTSLFKRQSHQLRFHS